MFFIIFFGGEYMKMAEISNLTYYQKKPRDLILNEQKDYYKNSKERLREQARDKYRSLSEEEKNKKRECGKNRYHNMSEEKKQTKRIPKKYRKANYYREKAVQYYSKNKEAIKEKSREHYKNLS